jgi:hypothetical protein
MKVISGDDNFGIRLYRNAKERDYAINKMVRRGLDYFTCYKDADPRYSYGLSYGYQLMAVAWDEMGPGDMVYYRNRRYRVMGDTVVDEASRKLLVLLRPTADDPSLLDIMIREDDVYKLYRRARGWTAPGPNTLGRTA